LTVIFKLVGEHSSQVDICQAAMKLAYLTLPKTTPVKELIYFGETPHSATELTPIARQELNSLLNLPPSELDVATILVGLVKDTLANLRLNTYAIGFTAFASYLSRAYFSPQTICTNTHIIDSRLGSFAQKLIQVGFSDKIRQVYVSNADPLIRAHFQAAAPAPEEILTNSDPLHDIEAFDPWKHLAAVCIFQWCVFISIGTGRSFFSTAKFLTLLLVVVVVAV